MACRAVLAAALRSCDSTSMPTLHRPCRMVCFAGSGDLQLHPDLPAWMAEAGQQPAAGSGSMAVPARSAVVLVERR